MSLTQVQRLFSAISGLWVGSFLAIGFVVVPIIFSTIGDRQIAGTVAAHLFKITAYLGLGFSALLMVTANHLVKQGLHAYRLVRWVLLGMLLCSISAAFILIPWMNSLRDQAILVGLSVRASNQAILFERLHHTSSILFVVQTLLGLLLVWLAIKNAD